LVFFDADCGICVRSARLLRRLDHDRRLRLVALQAAGAIVDGPPPLDVLLGAMHVRDGHDRWSVAGAAWIRVAEEIRLLRPLAVAARLRVVRELVEWIYTRVAANRHRISRLIGDGTCRVEAMMR
jgi:predicted DCC family thiol-disulfide oxidoreductase YuxK